MKTAELTGADLDYWVARAEGIPADKLEIRGVPRTDLRVVVHCLSEPLGRAGDPLEVLAYSTNWMQGGPLIDKWGIDLYRSTGMWYAERRGDFGVNCDMDPLIAICRAVVRAAFGDEVEDLPCE
jgi:hypothetical protein